MLNRMLIGWSNYFCLGPVTQSYEAIDRHCRQRLRQWLRRKHQTRSPGTSRFSDEYLYKTLVPTRLSARTRKPSVGESMNRCPRARCGKSARQVR